MGQCALKALRCRPHEKPQRVLADAFDYIEYPKALSSPDANPLELIQDALEQFLSRNNLRGDRVAISVPGQTGLARFVKLPPVESKKIPDLVKFEARQQIPFPLADVVWDYQQMVGGAEEEGFSLETEVGIFAMKREQVFRALKPFEDAEIEVDIVQLAPLALFNFVVFDQMTNLPPPEEFDPENPPESVVVLCLGTDTTDLVITNGYRVWQRSIPIGGSHFTKALSKELKLTFAKAEHLKRNAKQADDPKAIFRAMRPVFNDLLTELQRSIGYFQTLDRNARITKVLGLGNAMKLPALDRFVSQNLGYEVVRPEAFRRLAGPSVVEAPAFRDNLLSFATAYGLALQGLRDDVRLRTNLMPREVLTERLVRAKKPWALAAAAALMLGLSASYFGVWRQWNSVQDSYTRGGVSFAAAVQKADHVINDGRRFASDTEAALKEFAQADAQGQILVRGLQHRDTWLEVFQAISACLPRDLAAENQTEEQALDPKLLAQRERIHIESIENTPVTDLLAWFQLVQRWPPYSLAASAPPPGPAPGAAPAAPPPPPPVQPGTGQTADGQPAPLTPPTGPGWLFRLRGHHFHNADPSNSGAEFVLNTLVANLNNPEFKLPDGRSLKELGIGYAVLIDPKRIETGYEVDDPNRGLDPMAPRGRQAGGKVRLPRFQFEVQFAWQPPHATPAAPGTPGSPNLAQVSP